MLQHLFVYGTLAPGRDNDHVLKSISGVWAEACVRGKLFSEGWGAALGYPAMIVDGAGDEISGMIFSSHDLDDHWRRIDDFEGPAYRRAEVSCRLSDGTRVTAFAYVLASGPSPPGV
jgi:gamma-glutamylcyclotransferase (GGCT)/AIG2-like uncharacterized protein YtfP